MKTDAQLRRVAIVLVSGLLLLAIAGGTFVVHKRNHLHHMMSATRGHKHLMSKNTVAPLGCTVDLMVFRHCEKGSLRSYCTPEGIRRAEHLATLFGDGDERWPRPDALYARPPEGKRQVMREIELLEPLSKKFDIPIQSKGYEIDNKKVLVNELFSKMRSGEFCGKLALISWKHENIPKVRSNGERGMEKEGKDRWPSFA